MEFREWLLTEDVAFIRELLNTHQVIFLGKYGLWNAYSAIKSPPEVVSPTFGGNLGWVPQNRSVIPLSRAPKVGPTVDYFTEMIDSVKYELEGAAHKLVQLGFPKYTTNLVFSDESDKVNSITGGGVGGQAFGKQHAFTVDRRHVEQNIIIHEHAHMWWDNVLDYAAKMYFIQWYEVNVKSWGRHADNVRDMIDTPDVAPIKEKMLAVVASEGGRRFVQDLEMLLGRSVSSYFDMVNSTNNQEFMLGALFTHFRTYIHATTKKDIELSPGPNNVGRAREMKFLKAGGVVSVENVNDGYFLNWYPEKSHDRFEFKVADGELLSYVKFTKGLLSDKEKDLLKDAKKLNDDKMSRFLAPNSKKSEIKDIFDETLKNLFDNYAKADGWEYDFDPRKNATGDWYNTWVSMIGRRSKKGSINSVDDVIKTAADAMKAKLYFDKDMKARNYESKSQRSANDLINKIGTPSGEKLRSKLFQSKVVPSSYAASNYAELWAETIEKMAMTPRFSERPVVSEKLRKVIFDVLSGNNHIAARGAKKDEEPQLPRRLQRRKISQTIKAAFPSLKKRR